MFRRENGYSILELMVAIGIMIAVMGSIFSMLNPAQGTFAAQPEVSDLQQRLRVAQDTLTKDLFSAGAGPYVTPQITFGPLNDYIPPVLPYRQISPGGDPPGSFFNDRITVFYVPTTTAETTVAPGGFNPVGAVGTVTVNAQTSCPGIKNLCGFIGLNDFITTTLLIVNQDTLNTGGYGIFPMTGDGVDGFPGPITIPVSVPPNAIGAVFPGNSKVVEIKQRTYLTRLDPAAGAPGGIQLVTWDITSGAYLPVINHIAGLTFDYYGDPQPPQFRKFGDRNTVTYGPPPSTAAGNCVFADKNGTPVLPVLGNPANPTGLVKLTAADLTNGPWCPDAANANRYDADLLRIRRIGVTLRVEASVDALRGPVAMLWPNGSPMFARAGTAKGGERFVPDQEVRFEVSPRNLSLGR